MNDKYEAKRYVAGFLFDKKREFVALVRKEKPEWMAGFLNAIGGKINEHEIPFDAQIREFKEEAGVTIDDWELFCVLKQEGIFEVFFYRAFSEKVFDVKTMEEEKIFIENIDEVLENSSKNLNNIKWLLPMAMDEDLRFPITVIEKEGV